MRHMCELCSEFLPVDKNTDDESFFMTVLTQHNGQECPRRFAPDEQAASTFAEFLKNLAAKRQLKQTGDHPDLADETGAQKMGRFGVKIDIFEESVGSKIE